MPEQLETLFACVREATGADLPHFVKAEPGHEQSGGLFVPGEVSGLWSGVACKAEFDAVLECGILTPGFLSLRCAVRALLGLASECGWIVIPCGGGSSAWRHGQPPAWCRP